MSIEELKKAMQEELQEQGWEIMPYKLELFMDVALRVVRLINKSIHSKPDMKVVLGIVQCMYGLISIEE